MNGIARFALFCLTGLAVKEGTQQLVELDERRNVFRQAREYADSVGKPLLVVGAPRSLWNMHPGGDVTIDIDPNVKTNYDVQVADVRSIPYTNKYFGSAFVSHVLEHLPTVDDACQALDELYRVAYKVFVVSPHKTSIIAQLYTGHHLWVTPSGDGYIIEQRGHPVPDELSYVVAMYKIGGY